MNGNKAETKTPGTYRVSEIVSPCSRVTGVPRQYSSVRNIPGQQHLPGTARGRCLPRLLHTRHLLTAREAAMEEEGRDRTFRSSLWFLLKITAVHTERLC